MKARSIIESTARKVSDFGNTAAALAKCALLSRPASKPSAPRASAITVMGNGPSLRQTLNSELKYLRETDLMAVNFAPNSMEFFDLRPGYLVLADPHFFIGGAKDENVKHLWRAIRRVDWPMTLYLPATMRRHAVSMLGADLRPEISIKSFNLTPADGAGRVARWLYRRGWAMPRPRNVLIPALMLAMHEGYRDIRIVGADHSWSRSLWVDDRNRVISVQPHFYKDDDKEHDRVAAEYAGYHLHDILQSLTIAFRSYFDIKRYAASIGARITNCTPGSYIDAFPRGVLADMKQTRPPEC